MPWLFYLQESNPLPIEYEARWAPEPVWMLWRRENSLTPMRIQTLECPAHSLGAIPTTLLQVLKM